MSTTTFSAIRAGYVRAIRAITPRILAGDRFHPAPADEVLQTYAAAEESRASLFRMFTIADNHDDLPTGYTDLHTVRVNHTMTLDVAYPKSFGKYGRDDLASMGDLIRSDFHQIDQTIGMVGAANWQAGQGLSDHQGGLLVDLGPAVLRRAIYRIEFDLELTP